MSDLKATVAETKGGFHVEGYEKIEYGFEFIDYIFDIQKPDLAQCYEKWKRCLAVMDLNIFNLYGERLQRYMDHYNIPLSVHKTMIGEKAKSMDTLLSIVDSMTNFGIYRKEPVLVIGVSHVRLTGATRTTSESPRQSSLIDASVSIKVAVNYGNYKNRLGAYHAPMKTFLDFTFLRTLPEAQIRNGFAELIKISSSHFDWLRQADGAPEEVKRAADTINRAGIHEMLKLETPNLHEIGLDRVIAYGHTWSPLHELVPETPLRHGHAISIDMAYSATLANRRGLLSDAEHKRILNLFSKAGLSMDHHDFNEDILDKATKAILRTRDGLLRAAVPSPLGSCVFLNDVEMSEMYDALRAHKEIMKSYPRNGEGIEAFVDSSDTGYTLNGKPVEENGNGASNGLKKLNVLNNDATNGHVQTNGAAAAKKHAGGPEGVDGLQKNGTNGTNGHANGVNGHANGTNDHNIIADDAAKLISLLAMSLNYFTCTLGQAALLNQSKLYRTIPEFIDYQFKNHPDLPAVGTYVVGTDDAPWEPAIITFKDVRNGVQGVAQLLERSLSHHEKRTVALLASSSSDFLFTWLGLMCLGRPVLLIAPQCSASAVAHLCKACEVDVLFREDQYAKLAEDAGRSAAADSFKLEVLDLPIRGHKQIWQLLQQDSAMGLKTIDVSENDPAYFHHTSGTSSGIPKPIPQTHRGGLGTATFTTTPLYHGGVADLFRAWTSNALIWLFPGRDAPITGKNVIRCLDASATSHSAGQAPKVAYFSSVPYVLQMLAQDEKGLKHLQRMDMVGVGGAALPNEAGDELVRTGVKLVSRFGSAECGFLLSSQRDFEQDRGWQYLRPDPDVHELSFEPRDDGLSELVVRSGWPHMAKTNRDDRSFATSDLFEPHPSIPNAWRYHSRADSQLTLVTGKKFDPAPLEAAVAAASDLVSDAMIFGEGEAYPGVLLFRSAEHHAVSDDELVDRVRPVVEKLNRGSQAHAQIPNDMLVPMSPTELEKSSKGTLIRSALTKRFSSTIEQAYRGERGTGSRQQIDDAAVEKAILADVKVIMPFSEVQRPEDDLFAHGLDSVASLRVRNKLSSLLPGDVKLPLTIVQDCGTVQNLARYVLALRRGEKPSPGTAEDPLNTMKKLVEEYSRASPSNDGVTALRRRQTLSNSNTVLLTGATGSLGAHLLAHLLEQHAELDIAHIFVLVRQTGKVDPTKRVINALTSRSLQLPSSDYLDSLVSVYSSSLSSDLLGLDRDLYDHIAANVTHIYHLAWAVNFSLPLSAYTPHFAGIRNLLELGCISGGLKKFVFCSSTASVSSYRAKGSAGVPETIVSEPEAAGPTGYARSKWVAEAICHSFLHGAHAGHMHGKVSLVRVGQLSGSSKTGVWNGTEAYPLMLSASRKLGMVPDLDEARRQQGRVAGRGKFEECAWVAVDIAAAAFVQLGNFSMSHGEQVAATSRAECVRPSVLHLLPCPGIHSTWKDIVHQVLEKEPDAFRKVPIEEWLEKLEGLRLDDSPARPNGSTDAEHSNQDGKLDSLSGGQCHQHPALQLAGFWRGAYMGSNAVTADEAKAGETTANKAGTDQSDTKVTSGFNMEASLRQMPVLHEKWPSAVHLQDGYVAKCWEWIKANVGT
ncbi:2-epi-5-epi-valiolone synthase [Cyphellophora attinorum]|uniref:2-epi-5-epi-valiolone synthase n=1 Tax=Cyphellophora attinorum TaxID=1664694 RepID=A0A0N0NNV9_9EURO|nr:2-epi-5-epi-valiolone synthase [Phialophora attinorum]KPI42041.1 2-epi-5-epi-valiolone synthase [Phialophora attinorum]